MRLVPDFRGQFCPIFGQAEEEFLIQPLDYCSMKIVQIGSTYVVVEYSLREFICLLLYIVTYKFVYYLLRSKFFFWFELKISL